VRGANYVLRRTAFALVTIFFAITLNFIIFRAAPGDAASSLRNCRNCSATVKEQLRIELGLDKSKLEQYSIYLQDLAHGDLGESYVSRESVASEIGTALKNTLPMLLLATIFAVVFGTLAGVIAAWRRGTFLEWSNVSVSLFFYAMPTQWLGLMLILLFAGTLPVAGISDPFLEFTDPSTWEVFVDRMRHMLLPALTLGLVLYGQYALIARSSILQTLGEDYILTARAKGLGNWMIVWRHALRNALLPIVSLVALEVAYLAGGAILVEAVFSYPGIGLEIYEAVFDRDYPMLQGSFLVITVGVVFVNYLADLLYFKLDPRIVA
jgi:ABC-type dipeptide/oligopeptide/nickel transport system permease component